MPPPQIRGRTLFQVTFPSHYSCCEDRGGSSSASEAGAKGGSVQTLKSICVYETHRTIGDYLWSNAMCHCTTQMLTLRCVVHDLQWCFLWHQWRTQVGAANTANLSPDESGGLFRRGWCCGNIHGLNLVLPKWYGPHEEQPSRSFWKFGGNEIEDETNKCKVWFIGNLVGSEYLFMGSCEISSRPTGLHFFS